MTTSNSSSNTTEVFANQSLDYPGQAGLKQLIIFPL